MNKIWTPEMIKILKQLYPDNDNDFTAEIIGVSAVAVKSKAIKLKLKKTNGIHPYSTEEIEYMTQHYADNRSDKIAQKLKRSVAAIYHLARKLGLKKSEAYLNSEEANRLHKGCLRGINTRYKTGHTTWNKGVKGNEYKIRVGPNYERMIDTQFKPGRQTHNHKPIGSTRFSADGYYEVKTAEPRTWKQLHRVLWEEAHGEIPKHHCVVFRDGNPHNCTLENLELITRSEHATRNRHKGWNKYSEELKKVIHTLGALKRRINNAKKQIN